MRDGNADMSGRPTMVQPLGKRVRRPARVIALSLSCLLVFDTAMSGVSGLPRPIVGDSAGAPGNTVAPQQEWGGAGVGQVLPLRRGGR